ncbi:MAG: phosphoribosylformylglycinamidine cyclo-ligase [bacterium]
MKTSAYSKAGVDITAKMNGIRSVKALIGSTATSGTLNEIGAFGGFFKAPGAGKVLVASTDGVGTKIKIAAMTGRHDTIGQDIVNHCVNDILVHGAVPLFFLDYFGSARFKPEIFRAVVSGLCKACRQNNCALIGGETAEMPGLYPENEYDLVGTIVGVVDKKKIINGSDIRPGDTVIGLPSSGLHTNGYSLARKVIFETAGLAPSDIIPGTGRTAADILLAVHKSYLKPVQHLISGVKVRGMAHITGGGFTDNIARILPGGASATIDTATWNVPPVYNFIAMAGKVDRSEMYHVFNMGIGMVIFVRSADAGKALSLLRKTSSAPVVVGHVTKGKADVTLKF